MWSFCGREYSTLPYLSPPVIFTSVKPSKKHRHGQALLAMSVFAFGGQDGVGEIRFASFCQVRSRQRACPVTNFNTHIAFSERDKLGQAVVAKRGERASRAGYGGLDGYSTVRPF